MDNLLYYPYINVPRADWTLRTLLYYDSIGSIVPREYFYAPEDNYDPFMLELVRSELVTPIDPMAVLDNPRLVTEPFIEMILLNPERFVRARQRFAAGNEGRMHSDKFGTGTRIHPEKFDDNILYQLQKMKLARQVQRWFVVEKQTANDLMTFLATIVSAKTNRLPITDYVKSTISVRAFKNQERSKRETILTNLIPFPENIDLSKLRRFKEQHSELLSAFRTQVELLALDPSIIEGTPLFQRHLLQLTERKVELARKMNEGWGFNKIMFGTACGAIGAVAGLAQASGATSSYWLSASALASFANAIYSALQIEHAEDVFDQSGLKYLALADKRIRR